MSLKTADLCDEFDADIDVVEPLFSDFGGSLEFSGEIHTVKVFEDNSLVRSALEQKGDGKVLVVDGGGSLRCAMVGGNIGAMAEENGWSGIVVNGCIRDSEEIADQAIGLKALATHPRKSVKRGIGDDNVPVQFAGVTFTPGHYLYADEDGIIVSAKKLG